MFLAILLLFAAVSIAIILFQSQIFGRLFAHDFYQQRYNGIADGNDEDDTNGLAVEERIENGIIKNRIDRLIDKYQDIYMYEVYSERIVTDARKEAGRLLRVVISQQQSYDSSGIEHGAEFDLRDCHPR